MPPFFILKYFCFVRERQKAKKCAAPNGTTHRKTPPPFVATQTFGLSQGKRSGESVFTKEKHFPVISHFIQFVWQLHLIMAFGKLQSFPSPGLNYFYLHKSRQAEKICRGRQRIASPPPAYILWTAHEKNGVLWKRPGFLWFLE